MLRLICSTLYQQIYISRNTAADPCCQCHSSHQQQNQTMDSNMYGCTLCYHYAMSQCIYSQAPSAKRKTTARLLCPFFVMHLHRQTLRRLIEISCNLSHTDKLIHFRTQFVYAVYTSITTWSLGYLQSVLGIWQLSEPITDQAAKH